MARILIVDDERTDQVILGNIIEEAGHKTYFASDGEQAFKICVRKSIEVVVTDLQMPQVNGLVLITTLRAAFPETAIIAVSGKGSDLLAKAENKGAFVGLSKPVDPPTLLEAIVNAAPDA